ncbi:MAG TPA: alpha/beta hydrolase [Acidiferrobacteraceae bacterium]|nr:alpha/beta hydrolase [Acidiferrobacteraceae bacterium]
MRTLVIGLVLAYGLFVLTIYLSQSSLLYLPNLPSRTVAQTPAVLGLEFSAVKLTTEDGLTLDAWYIPAPEPKAQLLFFHGNAGNISHRLDSIKTFYDFGLSTLIIDYRGYGNSTGHPTEAGTYLDAQAAWRYLTDTLHLPANNIIIFGRSLGGAIAAHLARQQTPAALILESTFTSAPNLAADAYPYLPARWLTKFSYNTADYVSRVRAPVLVIHSQDDEIIPFDHGQQIFNIASDPKQFLTLQGGHNDGFLISHKHYRSGIERFLNEVTQNKK